MCVNVSDDPAVFDETFHVLKFSALASKVINICVDIIIVLINWWLVLYMQVVPVSKPALPQIQEEPLPPVIEYIRDDEEIVSDYNTMHYTFNLFWYYMYVLRLD